MAPSDTLEDWMLGAGRALLGALEHRWISSSTLFDQIDHDGSGSISKDELAGTLRTLGVEGIDLDKFFSAIDADQSGA